MKLTEYLKLKKPGVDDAMDIEVLNENFDAIDGHIQNNKAKLCSIAYGVCNTAKGTAAKVISCSGFNLCDGARILISFANGNTSNYMTLNVNNTGAYFVWFPIGSNRAYNNELISKFIVDGCVYEFVYQDGSTPKWVYCGAASILINDETPTYIEASNRENLSSGEKLSMAFGKIKKWFSDLKAVAFSNDYNDLDNKPTALKNPNSLTLTMNGSSSSYNGASSASKSWYAPTTAGTAGYELVSNGSGAPVWKAQNYAECTTAGTTAVKTVSITNFKLIKGARVTVKFAKEHSLASSAAQLNVSNTGAKPILYYGNPVYGRYESRIDYAVPINTWNAGETAEFIYDGSNWVGTQKHILNPMNVVVVLPPYNHYPFAGYDRADNITRIGDFILPDGEDTSGILQEAINNLSEGGRLLINNNELNSIYVYIDNPIVFSADSSAPCRFTIEATSKETTLYFRDKGQICANGHICAVLTLRHLTITSNTLTSIINLCTDDEHRKYNRTTIILDDVDINLSGSKFGEFMALIAYNIILRNNCNITFSADSNTEYMCWSGIDCSNLQVDDSTIKLTNNSTNTINPDSFDLNFIYNTDVTGYIRNSVLIGAGKYRTNFTNGQLKIDDCDIILGANASLCHYTTDTERKYSILRDSVISYSNSTYLTFGKVTGCTFMNTTNTNWAIESGKLQILCPMQMTNNTFVGRSEMNFNGNKVLFADNVLQYAQSYTTFPTGSVNANTMISG